MPTEAKKATVAELKDELSAAKAMIVADYRGLTVADISAVRRALRGEAITYRVVKNRLAKIAAQDAGASELVGLLEGPSALAMTSGDEVVLARTFLDAIRPFKTVTVRGAVLNGKRVEAEAVTRLSTLPSRDVLLGQLAGGMVAPLTSMASLLAAPLRNLGYALSQLTGKKEAAAPAEAAKAEAVAPPTDTPDAETPATEAHAEATSPEAESEAPETAAEAAQEMPAAEAPAEAEAAGETAGEAGDDAAGEAAAEVTADAEPSTETESTDSEAN